MFLGTGTVAETMLWIVYYLIAYPKIQERLHKELDSAFDTHDDVQLNDWEKTPYTEAVIEEVERMCSMQGNLLEGTP